MKSWFYSRLIVLPALITTAVWTHAQNCVTPPPGLVSWWRAENDPLDAAGSNDGVGHFLRFGAGMTGNGFNFSGSGDDYVALPYYLFPMPTSGQGNGPLSFDVWFKTSSGGVILGQQDVPPFGIPLGGYVPALYVGTNGLLYASFFWNSWNQVATTNAVNDGTFHHAAVTYDGTNEVLYLDGGPVAAMAFVQQAYSTVYVYQFGTGFTGGWPATPGGWFPFTGVVDEASLWQRALTADEVSALYHAVSAGKCVAMARLRLVHRYSFSAAPGTRTVTDSATAADAALLFAKPSAPYTNGLPEGSTFTSSGTLSLSGTGGYVGIPPLLVSPLSSVTFELWLKWNGPQAAPPQRIFQFGSTLPGVTPVPGPAYVALSTVRTNTNALAFEDTGFAGTVPPTETNAFVLTGPTLTAGSKTYIAVTYDPLDGISQLFVNGTKTAEIRTNLVQNLERFAGSGTWLGRSQQISGGFFHGELDEFRIWEGTLPDWRIAQNFAAGPDQPIIVYPPLLNMVWSPTRVRLRWRADISTGFSLESSASMAQPHWNPFGATPVLSNAWYEVLLPATNDYYFYRLKK